MSGETGGQSSQQPEFDYYLSLLRELEDKSVLTLPLNQASVGRVAIIDGVKAGGWWVSEIFAVDEEESIFVVGVRENEPLYDFVDQSRVWDSDLAIEKVIELEVGNCKQAYNDFLDAIGDSANLN
jgi:hypothetical protein